MKERIPRVLTVLAMLLVEIGCYASPLFEDFSDEAGISRKYFSQSMLHPMGEIRIASADFIFDASHLKVVDVIEATDPSQFGRLKGEVKKIAKSQGLEVLCSNTNKDMGNETVLYGRYDKKADKFTTLMLWEIKMGWQLKCIYVEGDIEPNFLEN